METLISVMNLRRQKEKKHPLSWENKKVLCCSKYNIIEEYFLNLTLY